MGVGEYGAAAQARPATQAHPATQRGDLVSVEAVSTHTPSQVSDFLKSAGIDSTEVRYGVRGYRITYRTITPQGARTTATGLLVLPDDGRHTRLDLVADTHGTMVDRDYAPSVGEDDGRLSPYLHASAGRAVAAPDYLGLGKGPGRHPYMDTASAVSASLDMLRATRTAARELGRPLTGDVYGTGFSQGGQVAMALGRALSQGADAHFRLKALAPVSGPYDIAKQEMPALFDGRVNDTSGVLYMAYWLTAQNRLHPLYGDTRNAFREPYARVVEELLDTHHTTEEVLAALPATVKEMLTPEFYARLQHPRGALLDAMRDNDHSCDWKPDVPVRLYTATGDTDVPIGNTLSCARQLAAHGKTAPVTDQGEVDHNGAFKKSVPQIVRLFNSLAGPAQSASYPTNRPEGSHHRVLDAVEVGAAKAVASQ
ncbi:alpha/beta hydrolase [Streptomyces sp. ASQP_92]|uniref:alpha/beta hydrolase n=1 Tax=Streptomyces sp. ASQP_92 TaxID=2979116 RepID=UPI0021C09C07|nr:alpha/beta hydrolase [Streptomyces sp. ASQP_92]MCT9089684.1 alpha/beta hydrolase [Streptomyces sp. ASQP_92]